MNYAVVVGRRVQASLRRLPPRDDERVRRALRGLGEDPRPLGCLKLTDRDGWRIRVGDYRIIYEIDDAAHLIRIIEVGHRRDVYRLSEDIGNEVVADIEALPSRLPTLERELTE